MNNTDDSCIFLLKKPLVILEDKFLDLSPNEITKNIILDSIILSGCVFGSFYLFSSSLRELNKKLIEKRCTLEHIIMEGSILTFSGIIMSVTTYKAFKIWT